MTGAAFSLAPPCPMAYDGIVNGAGKLVPSWGKTMLMPTKAAQSQAYRDGMMAAKQEQVSPNMARELSRSMP